MKAIWMSVAGFVLMSILATGCGQGRAALFEDSSAVSGSGVPPSGVPPTLIPNALESILQSTDLPLAPVLNVLDRTTDRVSLLLCWPLLEQLFDSPYQSAYKYSVYRAEDSRMAGGAARWIGSFNPDDLLESQLTLTINRAATSSDPGALLYLVLTDGNGNSYLYRTLFVAL